MEIKPVEEINYDNLSAKDLREARKDWRNLPFKYWNATTAREYLKECTEMKYQLPYVSNNVRRENAMISAFMKEYGAETLKKFIYECFKTYKATPEYPYPNFAFMYSFQRATILPRILKAELEMKKRVQALEYQQQRKAQREEEIKKASALF